MVSVDELSLTMFICRIKTLTFLPAQYFCICTESIQLSTVTQSSRSLLLLFCSLWFVLSPSLCINRILTSIVLSSIFTGRLRGSAVRAQQSVPTAAGSVPHIKHVQASVIA